MVRNLLVVGISVMVFLPLAVMAQEGTVQKAAADTAKAVQEETAPQTPPEIKVQPQINAETASGLSVEAELCSGIENRMPSGTASSFSSGVGTVYLWCKVTGCSDTCTISHVWYYKGEEMASVQLPIKSASYRTWSAKTIVPEWTGEWTVKVRDGAGMEVKTLSFTIAAGQ